MHSPYASKKRRPTFLSSFRVFVWCVCFSVWVREMWVRVSCAVVCMALTVHEHRVYTPDRSVLPPRLTSRVSGSSWVGKSSQVKSWEVRARACPMCLVCVSGRAVWARIRRRWVPCSVWRVASPRPSPPDPVRTRWGPRSYRFRPSQQPRRTPGTDPLFPSACPWVRGCPRPRPRGRDSRYGRCRNRDRGLFAGKPPTAEQGRWSCWIKNVALRLEPSLHVWPADTQMPTVEPPSGEDSFQPPSWRPCLSQYNIDWVPE